MMKAWNTFFFCFIYTTCLFLKAYTEETCCLFECPRLWIKGEYLGWILKKSPLPAPLITSASFSDPIPGAIGQPGTRVLLGDQKIGRGWQNGFQLSVGIPAHHDRSITIEGSYFLFPKVTNKKSLRTSGEPGSPNFAVPIFDVTGFWGLNGVPGETVFILPGPLFDEPGFKGHFKLKVSRLFQGAQLNGFFLFLCWNKWNIEGIGGLRWLQLQEDLAFKAHTGTVDNFPFSPGFYNFKDHFKTTHHFLGAQIGLRAQYESPNWLVSMTTKVALGILNRQIDIHGAGETLGGNLFFATKGGVQDLKGGVFAQPTNIGQYTRNTFAAAAEASLHAGYQATNYLEIYLEYTFLLINHIARPGDQINRKINPTLTGLADASRDTLGTGKGPIPFGESGAAEAPRGPKEPNFHLKTTLFWAQGLTTGIKLLF